MDTIADLIRYGIYKERISQKKLAEKVGKSSQVISHWKNNRLVPMGNDLVKIIAILKLKDDFYEFVKKKETEYLEKGNSVKEKYSQEAGH